MTAATAAPVQVAPAARGRRLSAPWLWLPEVTATGWLGFLSTVTALAAAIWIREDLHYLIGDSLARTANAVYVVASRDNHAGAIGFYWPPLHSALQIPLVLLLRPFGAIEWAGPLTSAIALGVTVALLGRLGRSLGVGRWTNFGVCAAFGLNPVMIFSGANGMSETTFFLFLVLALDGYVRWCRDDSSGALTTCSMALAALVLVRIEAVLVVAALVAAGSWAGRSLRQMLSNAVLIGLPALFAFAMWMFAQLLLLGDPLFFLRQNGGDPTGPRDWLPDPTDRVAVLRWAVRWLLLFGPVLAAVVPALGVRLLTNRRSTRTGEARAAAGLLGAALVFPVLHVVLLLRGDEFGNPRYFLPISAVAAVAALWAGAPGRRRPVAMAWNGLIVGVLVVSAAVATLALTDPVLTKPDREFLVFDSALGRDRRATLAEVAAPWLDQRAVARDIDAQVPRSSRILADSSYTFALVVFSERRTSFVIPKDRDFEPILADPEGKVDFVVTASEEFLRIRFGPGYPDPVGAVVASQPNRWEKVIEHGAFSVYRSADGLLRNRPGSQGP